MAHRFSVKLSELQRRPVTDSEGIRVGNVEDVWLEDDSSIWLVVGGNIVEETLAKLHIRPDIDLLVPAEAIASVGGDEITLNWSRFQLEATCQECWTREKERLIDASTRKPDRFPGLRLIPPRL